MIRGITISACVIMRDEEENIGDCLQSLVGNVDEILVVDTGSQDRSMEVARRFTEKVYSYAWQDDFAAAKNFALDKAGGEWIVFLDSDEYFSSGTRGNIRAAVDGHAVSYDALMVPMTNIDRDRDNLPMDDFFSLRIFRHDPALRYVGAVHESLKFLDGHRQRWDYLSPETLRLYHTGYSSGRRQRKSERNLAILLTEQRKNPGKRFLNRYLADAYIGLRDFANAARCARLEIEQNDPPATDASRPYHVLYDSLRAMEASGEERAAVLEMGMKAFPKLPDFFAEYGVLLYERGKYNKALTYFLKAEALHARYRDTREFCLLTKSLPVMFGLIADIYARRGDKHRAALYDRKSKMVQVPLRA